LHRPTETPGSQGYRIRAATNQSFRAGTAKQPATSRSRNAAGRGAGT
jgi:hypothetical protein